MARHCIIYSMDLPLAIHFFYASLVWIKGLWWWWSWTRRLKEWLLFGLCNSNCFVMWDMVVGLFTGLMYDWQRIIWVFFGMPQGGFHRNLDTGNIQGAHWTRMRNENLQCSHRDYKNIIMDACNKLLEWFIPLSSVRRVISIIQHVSLIHACECEI